MIVKGQEGRSMTGGERGGGVKKVIVYECMMLLCYFVSNSLYVVLNAFKRNMFYFHVIARGKPDTGNTST